MADTHHRVRRAPCPNSTEDSWEKAYNITTSAVVSEDQLQEFKKLLPNIKQINSTPERVKVDVCPLLHSAAGKGHLSLIEALLSAGADINYRYASYRMMPSRNPCRTGQLEAVKMLIENGCNVNAIDIVQTPLVHTIASGNPAVVELLLSQDVGIASIEALSQACHLCKKAEAELLKLTINAGQDFHPHHSRDSTPSRDLRANVHRESCPPTQSRDVFQSRDSVQSTSNRDTASRDTIDSNGSASSNNSNCSTNNSNTNCGESVTNQPSSIPTTTSAPSLRHPAASKSHTANPQHGGSSTPPPAISPQQLANLVSMKQLEVDNRVAIVIMLLKANIRIPFASKVDYLPYLLSHPIFKEVISTMQKASAETLSKIKAGDFSHLTKVSLVGECINCDKATEIARLLISPSSGDTQVGYQDGFTPLLHLDLSRNWIEERGATEIGLAVGRNRSLLSLNLAHNFIRDVTYMMRGMKGNTTLQDLNLTDNQLITVSGEAIAARIPTMGLKSLNLSVNNLEHRGATYILRAVFAAPSQTSRTTTNTPQQVAGAFNNKGALNENSIQFQSALQHLHSSPSGTLVSNLGPSSLTSLNLAYNEISPYDRYLFTDDLVKALTKNKTLESLNLSYNWLQPEDILRLIKALAYNTTLTSLHLQGYTWNEAIMSEMATALALNHTLSTFAYHHFPKSISSDVIRRTIYKNSLEFSNSHVVLDPVFQDDETTLSTSDEDETETDTSSQSTNSSFSESQFDKALSQQKPETSETENPQKDQKHQTNHLNQTCAIKHYGIVRHGDDEIDEKSYKFIPNLEELDIPAHPKDNSIVIEVHSANRAIKHFPKCILDYNYMTKLVLQRNDLMSLPRAIGALKNLVLLDVRSNRIVIIPPEIGDLQNLVYLLASNNRIQFLPGQLTKQVSLRHVGLWDNPLSLIPSNFRKNLDKNFHKPFQTTELFHYLKTLGTCGPVTFNRGRLMLVGDPAVGKTTIRKTLKKARQTFSFSLFQPKDDGIKTSIATDGIDIDTVSLSDKDGKSFSWDVWDYAGHEVYYTTHTFFLSPRAVYLLVFNMEKYSSLSIEYWMQSVRFKAGTNAPIFLVGTHPENLSPQQRTKLIADLKVMYRGIFNEIMWINPVTGENVDDLKQKICKVAAQKKLVGEIVPNSYVQLSEQLALTREQKPYMQLKDIIGMLLSTGILHDQVDAALSWLIDTGFVLYYGQSRDPEQLAFIDPQFLCNAFSQVVSIKYSTKSGKLSRGIIASICNQDMKLQLELFRILRKFDLAFVLKRAQEGIRNDLSVPEGDFELFVPALLSTEEPQDLSVFWRVDMTRSYKIYQRHYTFSFLPLGFFSKLLVRCLLLPGTEPITYWANGIIAKLRDEKFFLQFEAEKNLLKVYVNSDPDGICLALLVDVIGGLIKEWYPEAVYKTTIPVSLSTLETYYLDVDEIASNVAIGQYVTVIEDRILNLSNIAPDLVLKDLSALRVNDNEIEKGKALGTGSFGAVYEATYRGQQLAVKYITRFKELPNQEDFFHYRADNFAAFAHEIRIMNLLKHPNIVGLKGFIPRPVGLLMERFDHGDLFSLLQKDPKLSWNLRLRIALDIALGMEYLHKLEPPLCHRDLRSPNILMKSVKADSEEPVAKVADFGLTVAVVDRLGFEPTDSWRWTAPEVLANDIHTHRSDIWGFGIILMELITAEFPYSTLEKSSKQSDNQLRSSFEKGLLRPSFPESFDDHPVPPIDVKQHEALRKFSQLASACCTEIPEQRPPFSTIVSELYEIIENLGTLDLPVAIRRRGFIQKDDSDEETDEFYANEIGAVDTPDSISHLKNDNRKAEISPSTERIHERSISSGKIVGFKLDKSASSVLLQNRKPSDSILTTAVLVLKRQLWCGFADGQIGIWNLDCISAQQSSNSSSSASSTSNSASNTISICNDMNNEETLLLVPSVQYTGDHKFSIRGMVSDPTGSRVCAISEDGFFTIIDTSNYTFKKYQALPGNDAPLLSVLSIGERIYLGNAKGHVVAWSWDSPSLLAYWHGLDQQPCYQLIHTPNSTEIIVAYGQSIKFLNVFDLGDTLKIWKPHLGRLSASASSLVPLPSGQSLKPSVDSVQVPNEEPSLSQSSTLPSPTSEPKHAPSLFSATDDPSNQALFSFISQCKKSVCIAQVGRQVWSKSGAAIRIWKQQRTSKQIAESPVIARANSETAEYKVPSKPARISVPDHTISLVKELQSPANGCAKELISPLILHSGPIVFILESPKVITVWNAENASFIESIEMPASTNQNAETIEHIVALGDKLLAVSKRQLFIWNPVRLENVKQGIMEHQPKEASLKTLLVEETTKTTENQKNI